MKKTKKALTSLAIAGMALTMVPFNVFANGTVTTRLAGVTAEQTAIAIADQTGWTGTAILSSSASYGMVDALTAGPLAFYLKAPILLTGAGNVLNAATKAELIKLAVTKVYVTSGTAVISQAVLNELVAMNITVIPLGGFDRAATSVNIASKMDGVTKVAVANGLQDALSIAAIASAANEPILLTEKNALPASVATFLAAHAGITASDVIGGTGIISEDVEATLPSATRHAGYTAYDTNNQLIQDFNSSLAYGNVYLASGITGIDALAGAPLAAQTNSAIVLTDGTVPVAATFVNSRLTPISVVTALGGTAVVPANVLAEVAYKAPTAAPAISNVSFVSNNADVKKAAIGDTLTLTFTADAAVTKLGNFNINGSNPDTFTNVGNVYTVTHLVDAGDIVGTNATFQINVKNEAGIYSQTVEATTDGSSVSIIAPVVVENNSLELNKPYKAKDGMTITVTSLQKIEEVGSMKYIVSYTLKNETTDMKIDEATFKMYFEDGTNLPQYGFFGSLFPSQSISRVYTFEVLKTEKPTLIEYGADFFATTPSLDTLKWEVSK